MRLADGAIPVPHRKDTNMRSRAAWTAPLIAACALLRPGGPPGDTDVTVRSHNDSDVDVYLLCGDIDAAWLGIVPKESGASFAIPAARRLCPTGLNFFLIVQSQGRGYWVGPFRPQHADRVVLVIGKYAGLSSVAVQSGWD
jgi:hypothetical protein